MGKMNDKEILEYAIKHKKELAAMVPTTLKEFEERTRQFRERMKKP